MGAVSGRGRVRSAAAWGAVGLLVIAGWLLAWRLAAPAAAGGLAALCASGAAAAAFLPLAGMWAAMAAAMMLPTAVPAVAVWRDLPRPASGGAVGTLALVAGYLAVWCAAAFGFAAVQAGLAAAGGLGPTGAARPWAAAALCAAAALYQGSRLKAACLSRCRAPLPYFLARWRPGPAAATAAGLRLGLDCLGCCWALMLLALVGGMHSLAWMGLATLLMLGEKLPGHGRHLARPLALALWLGAGYFAAAAAAAAG